VSSDVAIERVSPEALLAGFRAEVVEVWASAHALPRRSPTRLEFGRERLPRHAGRDDFRFLGAFGPGRELVGFAYGYTGAPGQWWYDRVAAALDDDARGSWFEPEHFELTELAVRPDRQSRGIGTRLHDAVLAGLSHRGALLSALADNPRVLAFYGDRGWEVVIGRLRFESGRPEFTIMGRRLERVASRSGRGRTD
jgi:ribosomal protein S18 acetylase RimI-like enzyme